MRTTIQQRMTPKMRLEQRTQQIQRMSTTIRTLLLRGMDSPKVLYGKVVAQVKEGISLDKHPEAVSCYLLNPGIAARALKFASTLALPKREKLFEFAVDCFYDAIEANNGEIDLTNLRTNNTSTYKTTRKLLHRAFLEPDVLNKDLHVLTTTLSEQKTSGGGTQQEIREIYHAKLIKEALEQNVKALVSALELAYDVQDEDRASILSDFFRDITILDKLTFLVSERVQNRFSTNCIHIGKKDTAKTFENAFLSAVGEYVLVSMGVVAQNLFVTQSIPKSKMCDINQVADTLGATQSELNTLVDKYKMTRDKGFFWNRWAVSGRKASILTDNLVRQFITETVFADREKVLNAFNYSELYKNIRNIRDGITDTTKETREEARDEFRELLVNAFEDDDVQIFLLGLIREKWYDKLGIFYIK